MWKGSVKRWEETMSEKENVTAIASKQKIKLEPFP
jgi:hypothetical protein